MSQKKLREILEEFLMNGCFDKNCAIKEHITIDQALSRLNKIYDEKKKGKTP